MSQATQLSTFNFEQSSIRVIAVNNEPWFVATDICRSLNIVNVSDALLKLDDDEKATVGLTDSQAGHGAQSISIISESGMYTLILRCRDAVKKGSVPHRFRKWVTAEVLPEIRKTGAYQSKTTVDDRTGLRNAVNMLVSKKGLIYSEAYNLVHQYMNVDSIEDIPAEKLPMAVEYVHKIALEGELITNPFKPNDSVQVPLYTFKAIMQHARFAKKLAEKTEHVHRELFSLLGLERYVRNDLAALAYDVRSEFNTWLNEGEAILAKADPSCV
ncbi:phage repressor protein/antirepressor Ant, partial [[Haemophilus] felis]|nr:phage repressor protein/antirepressor Ant [[Haemophilus] felis]